VYHIWGVYVKIQLIALGSTCFTCSCCACRPELTEIKLWRLHQQEWLAAKFTRPQSVRLSCLGAILETYHKLQPTPKIILELQDALQRIVTTLSQKSIGNGCEELLQATQDLLAANAGHFEYKM